MEMFVMKCIQNNKINKKSGVMPLNLKKVKKRKSDIITSSLKKMCKKLNTAGVIKEASITNIRGVWRALLTSASKRMLKLSLLYNNVLQSSKFQLTSVSPLQINIKYIKAKNARFSENPELQ
jgi:hypothetical protein